MTLRDEDIGKIAKTLRELAHKRCLGSMDPIWEDVSELESHVKGGSTRFPREEAIRMAQDWLKDEDVADL